MSLSTIERRVEGRDGREGVSLRFPYLMDRNDAVTYQGDLADGV